MALSPCSVHHGHYRGPAQYAYPALVNGAASSRARLRICSDDFSTYRELVEKLLTRVTEDTDFEFSAGSSACVWCRQDGEQPLAIFCSLYPRGEEERTYYGRCHRQCAPKVALALLVPEPQ